MCSSLPSARLRRQQSSTTSSFYSCLSWRDILTPLSCGRIPGHELETTCRGAAMMTVALSHDIHRQAAARRTSITGQQHSAGRRQQREKNKKRTMIDGRRAAATRLAAEAKHRSSSSQHRTAHLPHAVHDAVRRPSVEDEHVAALHADHPSVDREVHSGPQGEEAEVVPDHVHVVCGRTRRRPEGGPRGGQHNTTEDSGGQTSDNA